MRPAILITLLVLLIGAITLPDATAGTGVKPCGEFYCAKVEKSSRPSSKARSSQRTTYEASASGPARAVRVLTPNERAFSDALGIGCVAQLTAGVADPCPAAEAQPVQAAAPAPAPLPKLTPGMVAAAFQKIPVPKERSITQPGNKTLVNFDTIFYTQADGFRRTVTLVGQRVTLDIAPVQYTWHHGDGTTSVTDGPGGPYPDKSVLYRYTDAHRTVSHYVVVTWGARFRVNGGPWNPVPGTVTSVGPATDLRIAEATPVLSGVSDRR